jgi:carboxyl-terminal processing protease
VYGGGGIMPDIFVPIDTTRFTDYHRKLVNQGVVNKAALTFIDKNRTDLKKKYPAFDKFNKLFSVDNQMLDILKDYAAKEKIEFNEEQYKKSEQLIKLQLKALVARDLWDMSEYYRIMDAENESLQKAIEILNIPGAYENILKKN